MSNLIYWGLGGVAAFFGIGYLLNRDSVSDSDAAQEQASQPSLPMFVSAGGLSGGTGSFGGGSGVMPALPASEFPALPASTFNFPEIPGTNEFDVAIADYGYRSKKAAFEHEQNLAKWTFDILKFGVENPVVGGQAGGLTEQQLQAVQNSQLTNKDLARRVTPQAASGRTGDVGSYIPSGASGRSGQVSSGSSLGEGSRGGSLDPYSVRNLFQTMTSSQAEYELYKRAQQTGANANQIADALNRSGVAPTRVFSAVDVENWKYERGLS